MEKSEIIFETNLSMEEMYIKGFYEVVDIKKYYKKEVIGMFNIEKFEEYYAELKAKRDEAIALALVNLEAKVVERLEAVKEEIAKQVEAEIVAEAEEPYKHDIELCEQFLVEEQPAEEVVEENVAVEGEF